jgi:hypothetical protein
MAETEWVEMTHPEVGDAAGPVTRDAFEQVWSEKGWQLKTDNVPEPKVTVRKPEGEKNG